MADRPTAVAGIADRLSLAASPTFIVMALATAAFDGGAACGTAPDASPLAGMAGMYLLMSVFHAAPWLRRAGNGRAGTARAQADG